MRAQYRTLRSSRCTPGQVDTFQFLESLPSELESSLLAPYAVVTPSVSSTCTSAVIVQAGCRTNNHQRSVGKEPLNSFAIGYCQTGVIERHSVLHVFWWMPLRTAILIYLSDALHTSKASVRYCSGRRVQSVDFCYASLSTEGS